MANGLAVERVEHIRAQNEIKVAEKGVVEETTSFSLSAPLDLFVLETQRLCVSAFRCRLGKESAIEDSGHEQNIASLTPYT